MAINKSTNNKSVLVTGATGYIGAHTVLELLNAGYRVLALGNSKHGQSPVCVLPQCLMRVLVLAKCPGSMLTFRACNLQNAEEVERIFQNEHFSAVIHLASSKGVAPSIAAPLEYYANNLISSINLFEVCQKYGPKNVVFMSSATVYGVPEQLPVTESSKTGADITNPYGWAKYMVEQMLRDICRSSKDWSVVILRAFDPAGAHSSGLLGEDLSVDGPKQLMPLIASVALGRMEAIRVCGNQFPTRDGSGSRDFVHVMDVARAIVRSLGQFEAEAEEDGENSGIRVFNLGLGHEHTVLEMIANYERACGKEINKLVTAPRAGDIASIHCDISLAQQQLNWSPEYGVEDICAHLNNWYTLCPRGYNC